MKKSRLVSLLVLGSMSTALFAQSLADAPVVFTRGDWKVLRTTNQMTDEAGCTGVYRNDYAIQLAKDSLFIRVSGGVQAVTLRFGDEPADKLRLATRLEKEVRAVEISGSDFERLSTAPRLRYQVSTLVRGLQEGAIDLTHFPEVLQNIRAGCPLPPGAGASASTPASSAPQAGACSDEVREKMKGQGLSEQQIGAICD